jgi:hypothetical protein
MMAGFKYIDQDQAGSWSWIRQAALYSCLMAMLLRKGS